MSRWLPDVGPALPLGLGDGRIAWRPPGGAGVQAGEPLATLREAAAAGRGRALHITVGNDVAVHWMQPVPAATRSLEELRQVARWRCSQLFGGAADDWWVAGDWDAGHAFACCALPLGLVRPIDEAARALRRRIRWQSAWAVACERRARAMARDGWNAVRSPSAAIVWHCTRGRVDSIARVGALAQEPQDELQERVGQHARLERSRHPHLAATPVRWHPVPAGHGSAGCEAHAALGWALADRLGRA